MAHTLVDKSIAVREDENVEICVLDPDQENEMAEVREKLFQSRMNSDRGLPPHLLPKKRYRAR